MERLPIELIEKVLSYGFLDMKDVINFSVTCKYFRSIVINDISVVWRRKFHAKFPKMIKLFDKNFNKYFDEILYIYEIKRRTMDLLEAMPSRFHKKYQLSEKDLEEWAVLMDENERTYHYILLHLMDIIAVKESIKSIEAIPLQTPGNRTLQYYASIALRFIKQQHIKQEWNEYLKLPIKQQTLEKGAVLVAQWCQPDVDITLEKVVGELDYIANLVIWRVADKYPAHQLLNASEVDLNEWKAGNLERSVWSCRECRQLAVALREVFYTELGFCGNTDNFYILENSLINKVLESRTGLPILLAVIYESVGRRLGLLFEPISYFPTHFLLRFTESAAKLPTVYYIDTFSGGDIIQNTGCPYDPSMPRELLFPTASSVQVVERIVKNLELSTRQHIAPNGKVAFLRAILELTILVSPQDLSAVVSLAKLYTLHQIDTKPLEDYLASQNFSAPEEVESILSMLQGINVVWNDIDFKRDVCPIQRTDELKYAVGMVMRDITYNDQCVIYGWNHGQPGRPHLPGLTQVPENSMVPRNKQPFYNVLVEDGSYRCVPQDALVPSSDIGSLLENKDLGRHFSHFFENHFVPNVVTENEYPYDKRIRHMFYHKMQLSEYKL